MLTTPGGMYKNVHSKVAPKSKHREAAQRLLGSRKDKHTVAHSHSGKLHSPENKWSYMYHQG